MDPDPELAVRLLAGDPGRVPSPSTSQYEIRNVRIWETTSTSRLIAAVRVRFDVRVSGKPSWLRIALKGIAFCHPRDHWLDHVGFREAVTHALRGEPLEVRRAVWKVAVPMMKGQRPPGENR